MGKSIRTALTEKIRERRLGSSTHSHINYVVLVTDAATLVPSGELPCADYDLF